ncbi:5-formyltetrahydrofolate cyclo-ligase, partial [Parabacteroides distasonis]|nr:5-formyltetrahydrofolate cyclo-ligase [Parabacteroides distasonis]
RGFYDRLLSTLNAPKVGICFGFQMIPQVPVEPLDKKMDYVITEDTIY